MSFYKTYNCNQITFKCSTPKFHLRAIALLLVLGSKNTFEIKNKRPKGKAFILEIFRYFINCPKVPYYAFVFSYLRVKYIQNLENIATFRRIIENAKCQRVDEAEGV